MPRFNFFGKYTKAATALFGAVLFIVYNHTTGPGDIYADLVAVGTALGIYAVPNEPR